MPLAESLLARWGGGVASGDEAGRPGTPELPDELPELPEPAELPEPLELVGELDIPKPNPDDNDVGSENTEGVCTCGASLAKSAAEVCEGEVRTRLGGGKGGGDEQS